MTAVNKQLETIAYCCKYLHHICCSPRGCCWQCSLFAFNHSKIIWQEPHSRKTVICLRYGREVKYKNRETCYSLHNYPNFEQISGLYLQPNQISKMKIFHKLLHLRCLTGFWMPLWNLKTLKHQGKKLQFQQNNNTSTSSPAMGKAFTVFKYCFYYLISLIKEIVYTSEIVLQFVTLLRHICHSSLVTPLLGVFQNCVSS